jgi:hypothetical protein
MCSFLSRERLISSLDLANNCSFELLTHYLLTWLSLLLLSSYSYLSLLLLSSDSALSILFLSKCSDFSLLLLSSASCSLLLWRLDILSNYYSTSAYLTILSLTNNLLFFYSYTISYFNYSSLDRLLFSSPSIDSSIRGGR